MQKNIKKERHPFKQNPRVLSKLLLASCQQAFSIREGYCTFTECKRKINSKNQIIQCKACFNVYCSKECLMLSQLGNIEKMICQPSKYTIPPCKMKTIVLKKFPKKASIENVTYFVYSIYLKEFREKFKIDFNESSKKFWKYLSEYIKMRFFAGKFEYNENNVMYMANIICCFFGFFNVNYSRDKSIRKNIGDELIESEEIEMKKKKEVSEQLEKRKKVIVKKNVFEKKESKEKEEIRKIEKEIEEKKRLLKKKTEEISKKKKTNNEKSLVPTRSNTKEEGEAIVDDSKKKKYQEAFFIFVKNIIQQETRKTIAAHENSCARFENNLTQKLQTTIKMCDVLADSVVKRLDKFESLQQKRFDKIVNQRKAERKKEKKTLDTLSTSMQKAITNLNAMGEKMDEFTYRIRAIEGKVGILFEVVMKDDILRYVNERFKHSNLRFVDFSSFYAVKKESDTMREAYMKLRETWGKEWGKYSRYIDSGEINLETGAVEYNLVGRDVTDPKKIVVIEVTTSPLKSIPCMYELDNDTKWKQIKDNLSVYQKNFLFKMMQVERQAKILKYLGFKVCFVGVCYSKVRLVKKICQMPADKVFDIELDLEEFHKFMDSTKIFEFKGLYDIFSFDYKDIETLLNLVKEKSVNNSKNNKD